MDAHIRRSQTDRASRYCEWRRQRCHPIRSVPQCPETGANGGADARGRALLGRLCERYVRGTLRQGGRPQRHIFRKPQDEITTDYNNKARRVTIHPPRLLPLGIGSDYWKATSLELLSRPLRRSRVATGI